MEKVQVTLSIHYKIVGSDMYGGPESIGYAKIDLDFNEDPLKRANLSALAKDCAEGFATVYNVSVENVTVISRQEYEANTEDEEKQHYNF